MREKVATKAINLSLNFNIPKANLTPNQLLNNKVEQNSISIAAPEPFQSSFLCSNHSLTLVGSRNKRGISQRRDFALIEFIYFSIITAIFIHSNAYTLSLTSSLRILKAAKNFQVAFSFLPLLSVPSALAVATQSLSWYIHVKERLTHKKEVNLHVNENEYFLIAILFLCCWCCVFCKMKI